MWRHEKLEDRAKYGSRRLYLVGDKLMGHDGLDIASALDQRWGIILGGGVERSIIF
jgi:hypothetical protein